MVRDFQTFEKPRLFSLRFQLRTQTCGSPGIFTTQEKALAEMSSKELHGQLEHDPFGK